MKWQRNWKSNLSFIVDYDTIETVICSSEFLYNAKRQRSLQHYIQLEPLPGNYSIVELPSGKNYLLYSKILLEEKVEILRDWCLWSNKEYFIGHYAACGFQVFLQRKQMQYQIQVGFTAVISSNGLLLPACPAVCCSSPNWNYKEF